MFLKWSARDLLCERRKERKKEVRQKKETKIETESKQRNNHCEKSEKNWREKEEKWRKRRKVRKPTHAHSNTRAWTYHTRAGANSEFVEF